MAQVTLTPHLARHVPCPPRTVAGATVRDVLEAYFTDEPLVRAYVLDDQGALRKHVVIFVDGQQLISRGDLAQPVSESASLYIMQALSGG
jgi:molybdopterin synthase sulfur carrier subunit